MQVIEIHRKRKDKIGARERIFRIASGYGVSREDRRITKILQTAPAVQTIPIDTSDPGDTHACTKPEVCRRSVYDFTYNLVTRNQLLHPRGQLAFNDMQIRPAHATSANPEKNMPGFHLGLGNLFD